MQLDQNPSKPPIQQTDNTIISLLQNTFVNDDSKNKFDNTSQILFANNKQCQQQSDNCEFPQFIITILIKAFEDRTSSDNSILSKYLMKKSIFKGLIEKLSYQLVKSMIRQGCIRMFQEGDILFSQGKRLKQVNILLNGEVAILHHKEMYLTMPQHPKYNQQEKQNQESNNHVNAKRYNLQFLDELINKVGVEIKNFKIKSNVQQRKGDLLKSMIQRAQTINQKDLVNLQKISKQQILDVQSLFDPASRYHQTIAVSKPSTIFKIPLEAFYEILYHTYQGKIYQIIKLFRKISAFDPFQNSQLKILIQKLKIIEYKKGQYIYKQGDETNCFYMLINGQLEISKSIQIFAQNPNNLYKSRIKMSRQRINQNIKILPYANFNRAYHFVPEQKTVTLAQISPICLFGQEQVLSNVPRQVNAKVLTLTAQLYQIRLQDIDQMCNKMINSNGENKLTMINFLNLIEERITMKKILLRQNQLSQMVQYENKNNFDKLFNQKQIKTSLSFRKGISRNKKTRAQANSNKTLIMEDKQLKMEEQVPPQFNHFNYNEFISQPNQYNIQISSDLNEDERKVIKLTHLRWRDPQNKKKQNTIRKRNSSHNDYRSKQKLAIESYQTLETISFATTSLEKKRYSISQTQKITIDKPLFNLDFFRQQAKQDKRLTTQAKKNRLQQLYRGSISGKKKNW